MDIVSCPGKPGGAGGSRFPQGPLELAHGSLKVGRRPLTSLPGARRPAVRATEQGGGGRRTGGGGRLPRQQRRPRPSTVTGADGRPAILAVARGPGSWQQGGRKVSARGRTLRAGFAQGPPATMDGVAGGRAAVAGCASGSTGDPEHAEPTDRRTARPPAAPGGRGRPRSRGPMGGSDAVQWLGAYAMHLNGVLAPGSGSRSISCEPATSGRHSVR
jgi:hypothetical protein